MRVSVLYWTAAAASLSQAHPNLQPNRRQANPECGIAGYDLGTPAYNFAHDPTTATAEQCGAKCVADPSCVTFAFGLQNCLLYRTSLSGNARTDTQSPYAFYDRACDFSQANSSAVAPPPAQYTPSPPPATTLPSAALTSAPNAPSSTQGSSSVAIAQANVSNPAAAASSGFPFASAAVSKPAVTSGPALPSASVSHTLTTDSGSAPRPTSTGIVQSSSAAGSASLPFSLVHFVAIVISAACATALTM